MGYSFYVKDRYQNCIPVRIRLATEKDLIKTSTDGWVSDWTSGFMNNPSLEKYAIEDIESDILIALCSYESQENWLSVRIAYAESEPESHPGLVVKRSMRRYTEIGKVAIAYGVLLSLNKGFDGTTHFKAKTTELYKHYKEDFGALDIPSEPYALILFGKQGIQLLNEFKEDIS